MVFHKISSYKGDETVKEKQYKRRSHKKHRGNMDARLSTLLEKVFL